MARYQNDVQHEHCVEVVLDSYHVQRIFLAGLLEDVFRFRNPTVRFRDHKKLRGMSLVHDWKDWLGGYPYEAASPKKIKSFFESRNYEQTNFKRPIYGFGCNYYLFRKKQV